MRISTVAVVRTRDAFACALSRIARSTGVSRGGFTQIETVPIWKEHQSRSRSHTRRSRLSIAEDVSCAKLASYSEPLGSLSCDFTRMIGIGVNPLRDDHSAG